MAFSTANFVLTDGRYDRQLWPRSEKYTSAVFDRVATHLRAQGFSGFSVNKPDADESTCIHQDGDVWVVYYSERGIRSHPAAFLSFEDAVNFFVWKVSRTSIDWSGLPHFQPGFD